MTTICFIGAGSVEFTRDLIADLLGFTDLDGIRLRLHDVDQSRLSTAEGVARSVASQLNRPLQVSAHPDRRDALAGAQFVVNMVQIGGIEATRTDFEIPAQYGLRQTIADTLGIGGIFRGLRTFSFLDGLSADILEICPHALLLNYTNPMAMNIGYLAKIAPSLRAYGLCHSVYWTMVGLNEVMEVPNDEVSWYSAGVNHQAWILSMTRAGQDLYPTLDDAIRKDPQLRRRTRVDMYRRLGYYPTETSEHSSEYVAWYLKHPEEIERLRLPVGAYIGISEENVQTFERTRDQVVAGKDVPFETEATEYAPQVIHSVITGQQRRIQVNVANDQLISNLPQGLAVEVPATVDELGIHPWRVGELPPQCAALNRNYMNVNELVIAAGVNQDPRAIRQAAMMDPNTAATLTVDEIWSMCDDLVAAHGDLLPEWAQQPLQPRP